MQDQRLILPSSNTSKFIAVDLLRPSEWYGKKKKKKRFLLNMYTNLPRLTPKIVKLIF